MIELAKQQNKVEFLTLEKTKLEKKNVSLLS
jgi:hypothetical protein